MIETPVPAPAPRRQALHWPSLLAALGGLLTIFSAVLGAGFLFLSGLLAIVSPEEIAGQAVMLLSYFVTSLLIAGLMLPAVVLAFKRLSGQPAVPGRFLRGIFQVRRPGLLAGAYILTVALGSLLSSGAGLDWLFMPVINVLALSLPVVLLFWLGAKNLPPSSPQRNWTVFGAGMTLSPLLIIVLELIVMLVGFVGLVVYITAYSPEMIEQLQEMSVVLQSTPDITEIPVETISAFVQQPGVIAVLLLFMAVIVPLIEESLKPIGVWLLAGRELTPQDGWVLGLISGAGFALLENLGNLAVGQGWWFLVLARGGAAGLHMFNSAIIGYTFVLSRRQKRWRPFVLAFLGTLGLHALWNSVAILASVQSLAEPAGSASVWPVGYLLILAAASLATILGIHLINRHLAGNQITENSESERNNDDRFDHAID